MIRKKEIGTWSQQDGQIVRPIGIAPPICPWRDKLFYVSLTCPDNFHVKQISVGEKRRR